MKVYLFIAFVVLDVAVFPFSCSNSSKESYYIFDSHSSELSIANEKSVVIEKLPKNHIISYPYGEELLKDATGEYYVNYWFLSNSDTPVDFPYYYKEEDIIRYHIGYRNCVVFLAHWEKFV